VRALLSIYFEESRPRYLSDEELDDLIILHRANVETQQREARE
jgi:hypothetical protein